MIAMDDARRILRDTTAEDVARRTWRAAAGEDDECYVATVLDLEDGSIRANYWPTLPLLPPSHTVVVLATITAAERNALIAEAGQGTKLEPSAEDLEAEAVRYGTSQGLDWADIESQLRFAYHVHRWR